MINKIYDCHQVITIKDRALKNTQEISRTLKIKNFTVYNGRVVRSLNVTCGVSWHEVNYRVNPNILCGKV